MNNLPVVNFLIGLNPKASCKKSNRLVVNFLIG